MLGVQEFDMTALAPENAQNVCTHHRSFVDAGDLEAPSEDLRQEGMRLGIQNNRSYPEDRLLFPAQQSQPGLIRNYCEYSQAVDAGK